MNEDFLNEIFDCRVPACVLGEGARSAFDLIGV